MWNVTLRFGALRVWTCDDADVAGVVLNALRRRLLRIALSQRLPQPTRGWAQAKLVELERLDQWKGAA